ncbi:hypothetical protein LTR53_015189, partial [Teratosphaeriaceae sp. CCFEE 6253]
MKSLGASAALAVCAFALAAQTKDPLTVDLGYAQYRGVADTSLGINTFFGIRYAASPTGARRWDVPYMIEHHNNYDSNTVMNATKYGPMCIQSKPYWNFSSKAIPDQPGSEDCLLLDILVPAKPANSRLNVMVQIHGGGYVGGNSQTYPGYALVLQSAGNIIYVSMQYRLGALGFLSGSEIRKNGVPNAGLLDQRAALHWVQNHIGAFGGDPAKVTIIGGSAGGGSVLNQLILKGGADNP